MFEDNTGAIALAESPKFQRRTKHVDVRHHFVREHNGTSVDIHFCRTKDMVADLLTKPLPRATFERLREMLMGRKSQPALEALSHKGGQ